MASAAVIAAVRARLDEVWTRTPIIHPNEDARPPADGSPFLAVQYPVATEVQASVGAPGNNLWREEGAFRLVLAIPRDAGLDPWLAWLDELRRAFRGRSFDGVRTYSAAPAVLDDRADSGRYWLLSSAVTYDFDLFG